jgi:hypothetical protein
MVSSSDLVYPHHDVDIMKVIEMLHSSAVVIVSASMSTPRAGGGSKHGTLLSFSPSKIMQGRSWTDQSVQQWVSRRDAWRTGRGLGPIEELRLSDRPADQKAYQTALDSERRTLVERLENYSTEAISWPVGISILRPF